MKYAKVALLGLWIATLGLWGCAKAPHAQPSATAQVRHLQSRNSKLEEDYRATVAECTRLRKKLTQSEEQCTQLQQERELMRVAARERDDLKQRVTTCQAERDELQAQLMRFGQELQSLAGKLEQATARKDGRPLVSTVSQHSTK